MRIESDHVRPVVQRLRIWGYDIPQLIEQDLVDEFDTKIDENGLSGGGQSRRGDPDTAKVAARISQDDQRGQVLLTIARAGETGLTNDEMYLAVDPDRTKDRDSWVPRIGELKVHGWVRGTERTRPGKRNVHQQVNVITSTGLALVRQKGWI